MSMYKVFHLQEKPIGVAKAAIRHLLGMLRQNPSLAEKDVLVCTENRTKQNELVKYLKEDLAGPIVSKTRDGRMDRQQNFWLLHRDIVRWCAWPPRRTNYLRSVYMPETKPSVEKQNNNEMNERSASSLNGFLGIEPPRLSQICPQTGTELPSFKL